MDLPLSSSSGIGGMVILRIVGVGDVSGISSLSSDGEPMAHRAARGGEQVDAFQSVPRCLRVTRAGRYAWCAVLEVHRLLRRGICERKRCI